MALNPAIFGAFAPRQRSAVEYAGDFADLDAKREAVANNALARAFSQAKLDEFNRATSDANALRQFQRGLAGKSDGDVLKAYRDSGYFNEAGALEKDMLGRDKTRAEIATEGAKVGKEAALARKAFGEAQADSLKRFRGALDYIDTPEGAARWLQAQYADPLLSDHMASLGPVEQAVTRIPRDPQGFQEWRQRAALGMEAHLKQQLEQTKANDAQAGRIETARLTERGQNITAATARRGQDLTDARARDLVGVTREAAATAKKEAANDKAVTKFSDTLQKEGIPDLDKAIGDAEGAVGRYKPGEVPGVGPLKGALPAFMMSDEGKDVRSALAAVRNIVLNARSGAAVTDQELRRLVEEIGTGAGMTETDARRGLKRIRDRFEVVKRNAAAGVSDDVLNTYRERGGLAITRGTGQTAAAPAAAGGFKYLGTE